jgi:phytoene dehydrogenase-like protein
MSGGKYDADVIVIGSGLGGLSAAALLAHKGFEVLVLERAPFIGGRARVEEKDGFLIDYGIHISRFHKKGKLAEVMTAVGGKPDFIMPGEPLVFKDGKFYKFPRGPVGFTKTDLLTPKSKLQLFHFMLLMAVKKTQRYENKSVAEVVLRHNPGKDMIEITKLFTATAIACPYTEVASAKEVRKFFESVILSPVEPMGYLKGSWKTYLDLMRETIERRGRIITRSKVEQLVVCGGRAAGVKAAGGEYTSKAVVCGVPFQHVPEIIDMSHLGPNLADYARRIEPTCGIVLDFALKEPVSKIRGVIMTSEPPSMGYLVSNIDPSIAPHGKQFGTWFQFITADKIKDHDYVNKEAESLMELVGRIFPGVWEACEWKRTLVVPIVDGAMLKVGQTWTERAPLVAPNVPNLFFVGDTTCGIGSGGDIALDSALRASKLVKKLLG